MALLALASCFIIISGAKGSGSPESSQCGVTDDVCANPTLGMSVVQKDVRLVGQNVLQDLTQVVSNTTDAWFIAEPKTRCPVEWEEKDEASCEAAADFFGFYYMGPQGSGGNSPYGCMAMSGAYVAFNLDVSRKGQDPDNGAPLSICPDDSTTTRTTTTTSTATTTQASTTPPTTPLPTSTPTTPVPTQSTLTDFTYSERLEGSSYGKVCTIWKSMQKALDKCRESTHKACAGIFSFGATGKKFRTCTEQPRNTVRGNGHTHWFCPRSHVDADTCGQLPQ